MNAVLMQSWNSFLGMESYLFINDAMGFNRNISTKDKQISPPKMMLDFLLGVFHQRNLPKIDVTHQIWKVTGGCFFFHWSFGHSWRLFIHWRVAKDSETGRRAVETVLAPKCVSWDVFVTHRNSIIEADDWYFQDLWLIFCLTKRWQRGRKMPLSKLQSSNWRCIRCKIWLSFRALPVCEKVFHLAEIQPVEEMLHQLTLRISHFSQAVMCSH